MKKFDVEGKIIVFNRPTYPSSQIAKNSLNVELGGFTASK
jgi:hypothetical protein